MIREMDGMKENIVKGDRIDSTLFMEPADFLIMKNQQEMMTSPQLSEYISRQRQRGFANIKEFEIEYHKRIAMSFASFILTLIGVSLSSKKTKGGMGLHLGIGLALSFSYILFQTIASVSYTHLKSGIMYVAGVLLSYLPLLHLSLIHISPSGGRRKFPARFTLSHQYD